MSVAHPILKNLSQLARSVYPLEYEGTYEAARGFHSHIAGRSFDCLGPRHSGYLPSRRRTSQVYRGNSTQPACSTGVGVRIQARLL